MANLFENKDRRVVPNWRSFGRTTLLGELDSFQIKKPNQIDTVAIDDYINDWKLNKTVIHGADLLSAAYVNNVQDNLYVVEAANFILMNERNATKSQSSLAKKILNKIEPVDLLEQFRLITFDALNDLINPLHIYQKIKDTRVLLDNYPSNAIIYVELSRYYSIIGNKEKSIRAMKTALHLSTNNRFVLRSAARLFAHYDELDIAHDILRKSPLTNIDPWLTSAEISIATIRNRTSRFIKKGVDLINSKNISPFNFTELASSIATVELLNGSTKKSRELFTKAIVRPNDNSLAQIEWASQKDKHLEINPASFHVRLNYEALAFDNFHNNKYNEALDNAARWFLDMPFSKRAVLFGSNLASTIIKDQEKSIMLLNAGLISHPNDPQLLNNLAYSLALENRGNEALESLSKIKTDALIDEPTQICITATKGLVFMRNGFHEPGKQMYLQAIEHSKKIGNTTLNWIAILNYAREEIRSNSSDVESIIEVVGKIPEKSSFIEVNTLRSDVLSEYEKLIQSR